MFFYICAWTFFYIRGNADDDAVADAGTAARFVVIGNATAGQYHLLIRYTVFPDDVGRWTCVSLTDSRLVQRTELTVLVPPPTLVSQPQLTDDITVS